LFLIHIKDTVEYEGYFLSGRMSEPTPQTDTSSLERKKDPTKDAFLRAIIIDIQQA
jgi:hypothetical protein